ncbi:hypothetical protein LE190_14330 [Massilia oculi]|uniref:Type II secretion system protein n=1 Tax=Massilia hydrophila TaxID=3044279 RepID=A0ABS7YBM1_9BURK|nr:hypothetical protein [Massilia oculi]MCA1857095.1 hypothetical protein [Massilia oculi]
MYKQSGISLFSTMLTLAIVVLLTGAVVVGQDRLVEKWTARALVSEMQDVGMMLYQFRDRYAAIPGDDVQAKEHVGGRNAGAQGGDNLIDAEGLSQWSTNELDNSAHEPGLFWQHVRRARLDVGAPIASVEYNAVQGRLGVTSGTNIPTRPAGVRGDYSVCSSRIGGSVARMMDAEVDDGNATAGKMWAAEEEGRGSVSSAKAPTPYENGKRYTVCMAF